jgi:hypothetical protein
VARSRGGIKVEVTGITSEAAAATAKKKTTLFSKLVELIFPA